MKKYILFFILFVSLVYVFQEGSVEKEKLVATACPTFYFVLDEIESRFDIESIRTKSTAESLILLEKGLADIAFVGRGSFNDEVNSFFEQIGPGYNFNYQEEIVVLDEEMSLFDFYTNLPVDEIIEKFNGISSENIFYKENVCDYLDKGITVTSLENSCESNFVHIFKKNGARVDLSRVPLVHYLNDETKNKSEQLIDYVKSFQKI